jgi:hypothetical protein
MRLQGHRDRLKFPNLGAQLMNSKLALAASLFLCATMTFGNAVIGADVNKPASDASVKPVSPNQSAPTEEEKAEKAARLACRVQLCKILRGKESTGSDIACHVARTWRKEHLTKLISSLKITWPYEGVKCWSDISLKRADLLKAASEPKTEITLDKHTATCTVGHEKGEATEFKFELTPKVTFENGKATKAQVNWGKIDAPTLIKSALWTATAADNSVNLLSSTITDSINDFIGKQCDEVKDQWAAKQ